VFNRSWKTLRRFFIGGTGENPKGGNSAGNAGKSPPEKLGINYQKIISTI
jgi:hypothetical protein